MAAGTRGIVSAATVRLTQNVTGTETRPGRPAVAQVNMTLNGRPLRVQTAAATPGEAVRLATEHLRELVGALDRPGRHERGRPPRVRPDERWPDVRPTERKVVRRKTYPLLVQTPDEAADTLETPDYDFHLFVDADSGSDSVIYCGVPGGYLLARVTPEPSAGRPTQVSVVASARPAPRLTLAQVRKTLGSLDAPFLFFADEGTGRGNVLYRRYDDDYGLIMPAS